MTITGRCLCGAVRWESSEPPVVTRVCWCRDCQYIGAGSGTVNACFRTAAFTVIGQDQRLSKCRGQWQPNAPAILSGVRDAALQRGRGAASSDIRPRRHVRRSESRESCDDDLDVVGTAVGLHQPGVATSGETTTAGGVTKHPSLGPRMVQTNRGYIQPYSERSVRHEALESRLHWIRRFRGGYAKSEGRVHDEKRHEQRANAEEVGPAGAWAA